MATIHKSISLGGTASDIRVCKVAHGLMTMTVRATPIPDEQAFEAIKAGVDALPPGVKMFLNSSEFYANDLGTGNLELLARFFDKYPDYVDKTFLSIKGGNVPGSPTLDMSSTPENLKRSVDNVIRALRGTKKIDLFESARVDPKVPVEDAMRTLKSFVDQGFISHVGISECRAETLVRANNIIPIAAVEIEVSPWSYEEETKKVIATAQALGIPVVAYSPLGVGFLTGAIKSLKDLEEGDFRRRYSRFSEENLKHNFAIVDALKAIAEKKGVTAAQLSIAWVGSLGKKVMPLPGSSSKSRNLENLAGADIELTEEEKAEIGKVIAEVEVKGVRYFDVDPKTLMLWG